MNAKLLAAVVIVVIAGAYVVRDARQRTLRVERKGGSRRWRSGWPRPRRVSVPASCPAA